MAREELPRVSSVSVKIDKPMQLFVKWKGVGLPQEVNLAGWVATGGEMLRLLTNPEIFRKAAVIDHGVTLTWDDGEGDLSIDALHLKRIADEQRPFSNEELKQWQSVAEVSNAEAADLFGVSVSTWALYKTNGSIPQSIALALRAAERDPVILQAHLRPRTAGRPRLGTADGKS